MHCAYTSTPVRKFEAALVESEQFKNAILTAALDCIISINHKGEIISFNQASEQTFGYRSEDVIGKKLADMIIPPERRERHRHSVERYLVSGESTMLNRRIELTAMRADGSTFPVELAVVPLNILGNPIFTAFIRDISEMKQRQDVLRDSALRYRQLVELSPEAIFVCHQTKLTLLNQAASRLLGAQHAIELLGRSIFDFIRPDYHALLPERPRLPGPGIPSVPFVEQVWVRLDGTEFHVETAATNLIYNDSPAVQIVVRDITERKQAEELQLGQNRILNMVATGVPLPEILTEIARFMETHFTQGMCSITLPNLEGTALSFGTAPSLPTSYAAQLGHLKPGRNNDSSDTALFQAAPVVVTDIANDPLWEGSRDLALKNGFKAWSVWPIVGKNRKMLGTFILYFREPVAPADKVLKLSDICINLAGIAIESRASEERIRYLAHYDGLTSLPNRFLFKEYLDLALRKAKRHGRRFAVFFLDLDKFKDINDTFGHDAGDQVLKEIATRLRNCLRSTDKIARMGGDEFYVLIEDLTDGRYVADIAEKLLEEASRPVYIDQQECRLSASIGIAIYPDNGSDGNTLLKKADSAMYRVKDFGKNGYQFHAAGEDTPSGEQNILIPAGAK
jgi:diguanylate cyclase (GGDEF)-like protein/PAS domain S-box-containing protein